MAGKVLITGGAGYIGSHTVLRMLESGYMPEDIIVFDNLSSGHKEALLGGSLVIGDLRKVEDIEKVFTENQIDAVVHFAGFIEVGESVVDPKKYFEGNLVAGINLVNTMLKFGVKKIVFSSTAAVYGAPEENPITEDAKKEPTNPYGLSKWQFEQVLEWYSRAYGLSSVRLRYFNASGADIQSRIGEAHEKESHLIPLAIYAALGKRAGLKLFGTDYETKDGTCVRDYIHVLDLADAHILALKKLETEVGTFVYNLGNGNGYSVKEILDLVKQVTGRDFAVEEVDRRAGDPAVLIASAAAAKRELGWNPKYGDLEAVVRSAWNWHRSKPNGYKQV